MHHEPSVTVSITLPSTGPTGPTTPVTPAPRPGGRDLPLTGLDLLPLLALALALLVLGLLLTRYGRGRVHLRRP